MPLRDLLVHIDASKHSAARLEVAAGLARRFDAHLSAIYVGAPDIVPPTMADQYSRDSLDAIDTRHAVRREAVEALFNACVPAGEIRRQLIEERGSVAEAVTQYARCHDLTILGQVDPDTGGFEGELAVPDEVGLNSGKPILMVPYAGRFSSVGERVMVAWNESPQAARAIKDALPFLAQAKKVTILAIARGDADELSTDEIVAHLDRHGIAAETERLVGNPDEIGDLLLSRAADETADLMVMGLYSHSRLREQVFGGVSREVLHHMTIPVLMSH
jgi:nucleotide-binding universal stress UspA family protein